MKYTPISYRMLAISETLFCTRSWHPSPSGETLMSQEYFHPQRIYDALVSIHPHECEWYSATRPFTNLITPQDIYT